MPEVEYSGLGSQLGKSCMGVVLGPILFISAFPLLFMNEGCAVKTARDLAEGKQSAVEVSADKVDEANDTKLVHVTGEATTSETLYDKAFGIAEKNAIKLSRNVEIYQWTETSKQETKNKLGGGKETITYYYHEKKWVKDPINSSGFKNDDNNPPIPRNQIRNVGTKSFPDQVEQAKVVKLGAFTLSTDQVNKLGAGVNLPATKEMIAAVKGDSKSKLKVTNDGYLYIKYAPTKDEQQGVFFLGMMWYPPETTSTNSTDDAQIGDQRISFKVLKPETVSVLAQQSHGSFVPWKGSSGTDIDGLEVGIHSKDEMIGHMEAANVMRTWILRFVGFALMAFGIFLVGSPFVALADILPFLGDFVSVAIGFLAVMIAIPLALITIALGWVFYRPLIGIPMLVVGVGALGWIIYLASKRLGKKGSAAR